MPKRLTSRLIRRIFAVLLVLMLGILVYIDLAGIPQWLKHEILRRMSRGDLAFEIDTAHCHVLRSFDVNDLRVFFQGQIGPPVIEAENVQLQLEPLAGFRDQPFVPRITLENVVLRPALARFRDTGKQGESSVTLDIDVELINAEIDGMRVKHLRGHLLRDAEGGSLTRLSATLLDDDNNRVTVEGGIWYRQQGNLYSGQLMIQGDPGLFIEPMQKWGMTVTPEIISRFDFDSIEPRFLANFHRGGDEGRTWLVNGRIWMEEGSYCGVDVMRADCFYAFQIGPSNRVFQLDPVLVVREEGLARGGLTIESAPWRLTYEVSSTLDPHALAGMVGVLTNVISGKYIYEEPYRIESHGVWDFSDSSKSRMYADVDLGGIRIGELDLLNTSFAWSKTGYVNAFDDVRVQVCGGVLQANGYLARPAGTKVTSAFFSGDWRGIDLTSLADRLIGEGKHKFSGEMKGHLHLLGVTGKENAHSWAGNGDLKISDGQLLKRPEFGGLTQYLGKVVPGVDLDVRQTDARATFRITDQAVRFDEFLVEGDLLSLVGKGHCGFDRELDFGVEMTFFKPHTMVGKIIRLPTYIFSKLLEFRVVGPLSSPHWYPVNFSKDIWERLGLKSDRPESDDGGRGSGASDGEGD